MPANKYPHWAIVFNPTKPNAGEVATRLLHVLEHFGATGKIYEQAPQKLEGTSALVSIGGDGTMLGCVETAIAAQIPMVGVNMGTLGYLTSIDKNSLEESFGDIMADKYRALERNLLSVELPAGKRMSALNDVVIKSSEYRLAELKVSVDGELVTEYSADGLIFATPTGTTAYNLSAGGPIMHLKTRGIVMTPICAHTLSERSVVFAGDSVLKVEHGRRHSGVHINMDGRTVFEGSYLQPITITLSEKKLITLESPKRGQFEILRRKLGW